MSQYVASNQPASRFRYPHIRLSQQANSDFTEVCLGNDWGFFSLSMDFVQRKKGAAISGLLVLPRVEHSASTCENKIALLLLRSGKIWPVDITTIFPLIESVGHKPAGKAANQNVFLKGNAVRSLAINVVLPLKYVLNTNKEDSEEESGEV